VRPRLPSPSMTVSMIALLVALGGTAYAGLSIPRGSVGKAQLKRNAVTSVKVRNGSLKTVDFSANQRAALVGPAGPPGDTGPQGPAGTALAYAHVNGDGTLVAGRSKAIGQVTHPAVGTYCFTGLPSGVANVVATMDVNQGAPAGAGLPQAQATLGPGTFNNTQQICPGAQAAVLVVDDGANFLNKAFYVSFN
jgi:hypothetical protein